MDTPLRETRPLTENGRGGNLYLGAEFLRQVVCPIEAGDTVVAQIVPHTAVILFPEPPRYPVELTVRDPLQAQSQSQSQARSQTPSPSESPSQSQIDHEGTR